jgi:crotonobetainyl-CoA:carnitine CoA-transferase CaiB-like acyl-CoA transferase
MWYYVVIATANDNLFHRLVGAMKQPELLDIPEFKTNFSRKEHQPKIEAIVEKWTMRHTTADLEQMLDAAGVPVAPIKTVEQLCEAPPIKHRNMLVELEHPVMGKVKYPGNPINLYETPVNMMRRDPLLGEHNMEILNSIGYSDGDIAKLKEDKVI